MSTRATCMRFGSTAGLLLAAIGIGPGVDAAPGGGAVRNVAPQKSMTPPNEQWPVHYPRSARPAELAASEGAAEHLLHRFINLHTAMRYGEAEVVARELIAGAADRPLAHYNHACVLARLGREDEAIDALERAVDHGWRNTAHTAIDPDLRGLANDPRFGELLVTMRKRTEAERIGVGPLRDEPWPEIAAELTDRVPALLERYHVPGAAVGLVHDGRLVWAGGFGVSDGGTGVLMDDGTAFEVASPDDLLLLIAAAQLDDQDKLDLGDLLLAGQDLAMRRGAERRIGQAGGRPAALRQPFGEGGQGGRLNRGRADQRRQRLLPADRRELIGWPFVADTDETRDLLRLAVEIASHEQYADYRRSRILEPLGLAVDGARARGHSRLGTPIAPADRAAPRPTAVTVRDLGTLVEVLFHASRPETAASVLRPGAVDRLIDAGGFGLGPLGLSVHTDETRVGTRVQVTDVTAGVGCLMRWYPEHGRGVVVLFNSETGPEAALRIAVTALGGI